MSTYVNLFQLPTYSASEIAGPFTVTVEELETTTGNTIVTAKRFDTTNQSDPGTDISTKVTIGTNVVSIENIWASGDTPTAGSYRVQVVSQTADGTQKQEINGLITIV